MAYSERQFRDGPLVSVVMANFEAGDRIVPALASVLGQTMADLEVIVSDDASGDDSVAHVRAIAKADPRIVLIEGKSNRGPAHCRNRALDVARGRWVAVVDSDDIIHPERFERLLALAARSDADIVADDLLLFHEDGSAPRLMLGTDAASCFAVSPMRWVMAGIDGSPALGYLKPMIRAECLKRQRYDEALRIGEDYDFVLRLLLGGAAMVVVPEPFYLYRRHSASISHRLSGRDVRAMIEQQQALVAGYEGLPSELSAAFARRLSVLREGLSYEELVAAIKQRRLLASLGFLARRPSHLHRLWTSFTEGRQRRSVAPARTAGTERIVLGGQGAHAGRAVPAYVPSHLVDWSAPRPREVWLTLASHAGARCIAMDDAGRYAAGFIPEVQFEARVREVL